LKITPGLIQRYDGCDLNLIPLARLPIKGLHAAPKHDRANACVGIAQREINMAAGRPRKLRNLAPDAQQREMKLKALGNSTVEFADGQKRHVLPGSFRETIVKRAKNKAFRSEMSTDKPFPGGFSDLPVKIPYRA
jgi:hypothetical protein